MKVAVLMKSDVRKFISPPHCPTVLPSVSHPFYTPPHDSSGILWFHVGHPCVCPSSRPSVIHPSVRTLFPDDNLSKYQWIFTKLGRCIDIVEIWFEIANGQSS